MDGSPLSREAQAAADLRDRLIAAYGEQIDETAFLDAIDGQTDFLAVVGSVLRAIHADEAMAAAIQAQEVALAVRRKRFEQRAEKARDLLGDAMERAGVKKLTLPEATLSLRAVPPAARITAEEEVPPSFWITPPPKLDKKAIAAALKTGADVPGAVLGNGSTTLSIRGN